MYFIQKIFAFTQPLRDDNIINYKHYQFVPDMHVSIFRYLLVIAIVDGIYYPVGTHIGSRFHYFFFSIGLCGLYLSFNIVSFANGYQNMNFIGNILCTGPQTYIFRTEIVIRQKKQSFMNGNNLIWNIERIIIPCKCWWITWK